MIYYVSHTPLLFESENVVPATVEDALEHFKDKRVVQVDTETTGLDFMSDRILLLQLGNFDDQYVINAECNLEVFKPLLEDPKVLKILQNAKFDYKFLRRIGIRMENVYDTQIVEQIIHGGKESISFSLKAIAERYLSVLMNKDIRESFISGNSVMNDTQIVYAANDVKYLELIRDEQLKSVSKYHLDNVTWLENNATLALGDIEYNGMAVNTDKWLENSKKSLKEIQDKELELDSIAIADERFGMRGQYYQQDLFKPAEEVRKIMINWNSASQVLGLMRKIIPNLDSVNADVLYPHRKKHKLVLSYLDYKKKQKLYTSYGPNFLNLLHADGRVHPEFRQILNTGRVSCNNPNLQQIPSGDDYRNCFVPGYKDYVFVSSDYSSQELAVIAYGSGDPVWLEALQNKQDLHSICAELIFGSKWKNASENDCSYYLNNRQKCECAEHKKLRTFCKTINFGLAYGMSAFKLSDRVEIPLMEAEQMISKYFSVFPKIKHFLNSLGNFGKKNGFITTYPPFKRIRWFENWNDQMEPKTMGEIERASMNTPIQGSSADMTKLALVYVREFIHKNNAPVKLVMTVHDQIDTLAHKDYAEQWKLKLEDIMELAAIKIIKNGLLKAETSISVVWKK